MKKILLLIAIVFTNTLFAGWDDSYVFVGVGQSYYLGDLNSNALPSGNTLNISYKAGFGYDIHPKVGIAFHYTNGGLNGSDLFDANEDRAARGLSFSSPYSDFGVNLKVKNLLWSKKRLITYLSVGVNYFTFNPTVTRAPEASLSYLPEVDFAKSGFNIPYGAGIGYWINSNIALVWETHIHKSFTDFIDGVSRNANPNFNDGFVDSHILLRFTFGEWGGSGRRSQKKSRGYEPRKVGSIKCPKR